MAGYKHKEMGRRLRQARERVGLSQEEVAEKLGVDRVTVTQWESGRRRPSHDHLIRLAELYRTTTDALLGVSSTSRDDVGVRDATNELTLEERLMRVLEDLAASLREREETERIRVEKVEAVRAQAEAEREASIARLLDVLLGDKSARREQAAAGEIGARDEPLTGAAAGR